MHHFFKYFIFSLGITTIFLLIFARSGYGSTPSYSHEQDGFDIAQEFPLTRYEQKLNDIENWSRPEGPIRVALQSGHWLAAEAPDEFPNLKSNTGTSFGSYTEWETNLMIANKTKEILEQSGIIVDILPATIPPNYWADAFVAIHADGNANRQLSGFKVSPPRRDATGKAAILSDLIEKEYQSVTKLSIDPNISANMLGYYAFNWRRYEHSLHPMTPAVIIETGFLTNQRDRQLITKYPEKSAQGIANAILKFLEV